MTKQILQDENFIKLLEDSKKSVKDSDARMEVIKKNMVRIRKESKEIDRRIRLLL